MGFGGFLKGLAKIALPAIGTVIAPGIGTAIGGSLAGAIGGMGKQNSANKTNKQALDIAMKRYNETAPLRSKALQLGMNLQPNRPNLSSAFASGNPFGRQRPDLSGLRPAPTSFPTAPMPMGGGGGGGPVPPPPLKGFAKNVSGLLQKMQKQPRPAPTSFPTAPMPMGGGGGMAGGGMDPNALAQALRQRQEFV